MFDDTSCVSFDFESYYTRDYSLSKMPTWQYCADERFDPYLLAICGWQIFDDAIVKAEEGEEKTVFDEKGSMFRVLKDGRQLYVGRPENFKFYENVRHRVIAMHNASFDEVCVLECIKRGLMPAFLKDECKYVCTADLSAFLLYPRNLKGAMKEMFGKEISKEVRAGMMGRHDYELTREEYRALVEYGGSDAVECLDIWLRFCSEFPELYRRVSELNRESTIRGIRLDLDYVRESKKELERYLAELTADIPWAPEKPVGSLAALRQAVIALGIDPPESFRKDDPRFLRWLETHDNLPFIKARQKAASVTVNLARVKSMLDTVDPDGRSHPAFTFFGAHTGRFSGRAESGGNVNLLNLPRKPVMQGDEHIFSGKGVDIRGMYVPDPGCKFAVYDYAQVESRFALWLVDDTHMMGAIEREGNLYQANSVAMGWSKPGDKIKKTNPDLYRLAKCATLGLGYGMGADAGSGQSEGGGQEKKDVIPQMSIMTDMFAQVKNNDLKSFKSMLESDSLGISPYINTVQYSYGITPQVYSVEELRHGTSKIITDPHEIVNVGGADALIDILNAADECPVNYYIMLQLNIQQADILHNYMEDILNDLSDIDIQLESTESFDAENYYAGRARRSQMLSTDK